MDHIEPPRPLRELDPAARDAGYWNRFHDRVMRMAAPELARRRDASLSVSEVLLGWSRLLVPGAAIAAGIAAMLLLPEAPTDEPQFLFGVEDILREEALRAELAPVFFTPAGVGRDDDLRFAVEAIGDGGSP